VTQHGESGSSACQEPALVIRGLRYATDDRPLFDNLELSVDSGESVAVVGPSGSGKSTLLSCALGLVRPAAGTVEVVGADILTMRRRALERHRARNIGVVFQFGELLPELTPVENVALAALLGGAGTKDAYERAERLLAELGVPATEVPTGRLSGGERQRAAVARALVNEPALLLADEPTGALDHRTRDSVAELLFSVPERWGCALVVVTHDLSIAQRADRCLELRDARLADSDPVMTR
jgi:ABC-type lipoprotein export system ATPase subunit